MLEPIVLTAALNAGPQLSGTEPDRPDARPIVLCQRAPGRSRPRPRHRGRPRLGPGSLRAHENSLGHCCRKHIGRTPEQLRMRLRQEPEKREVSTFRDMKIAQISLREVLRHNETRINNWLNSGLPLRIEVRYRMGTRIGMYMTRRDQRPRHGYTANFVLQLNEHWPHGFQVVTGYVSR